MKLVLVVACAVVACGAPKNSAPTPQQATVIDWKLAQSDRVPIRNAATADVKSYDREYIAHPTPESAVELAVHIEAAKVTYQEDGEEVHFAPIAITAKVLDSGDYTLGKVNCSGPHFRLADGGAGPHDMLVTCHVNASKPSTDVGFRVRVFGSGAIDDGAAKP